MARIRSLKPEFWTDEKVVELSPLARLLFIGLWNFCDDDGRMALSAKRLKLQILPADSADISALLGEIRREGLVTIYTVEDKEYLQVNGFAKHQKVDRRTPSKIPPPPISPDFPRVVPTEGIKEGIKEGSSDPKKDRALDAPPVDLKQQIFGECLDWLAEKSRKRPDGLRSLIGRWIKQHGEAGVLAVFIEAQRERPISPVDWIEKALQHRTGPPSGVVPLRAGGG